jgi:hypothetical protein
LLMTKTHLQSNTPLHNAWLSMNARTHDLAQFPSYAGVRKDSRWDTFEGFVAHPPAGEFEPGKVLSRIADRGNYTPENCRWLTKSENVREMAENRTVSPMRRLPDGRFAKDVAREHGVSSVMLCKRIKAGWSIERAATEAPHAKGRHRSRLQAP